jgi:branched-chain amino acid transport system permease protein
MFEATLQFIVNGLVTGCIYALVALGLTLIFGMMGIVNYAQGEFFVLGGMLAYVCTRLLGLPFFAALPIVLIVTALAGASLDWMVLRRLRKAHTLTKALVTLGMSIFLINIMLMIFGAEPKNIQSGLSARPLAWGPILITPTRLLAVAVAFASVVTLHVFIHHSRTGRAMRAVFQQPEAAMLVGIPIQRIYSLTFALGTMLAALAGSLVASIFVVYPSAGQLVMVKAFAVVIVGGMGSFPGAIIGGLILGMTESLWGAFISTGYADAIGFVLVIFILLLKPHGLFGIAGGAGK